MPDRSSIRSNRLRSTLALCVLAATPAATCGITLGQLFLRVQAIEAVENVVIDSLGQIVGEYDEGQVVLVIDGFQPIQLGVTENGFQEGGGPNFESTDCSGTPYMEFRNSFISYPAGYSAVGWFAPVSVAQPRTVAIRSYFNASYGCRPAAFQNVQIEVGRVETLDAFVPPFRLVSLGQYFSGEAGQ